MKCPCCQSEIPDPNVLYHNNRLYIENRWYKIEGTLGPKIVAFINGPVHQPDKHKTGSNANAANRSRIRRFLRENNLPYELIKISKSTFQLVRKPVDVQDNLDAQRQENVHP